MSQHRRKPKAVLKLIADAQERQVENAVVAWIKGVIKSDQARRDGNGGGTRRNGR